jgi:type VI secretion system protein VasG
MSDISRAALFGKLNSVAYKAVEGATVFCKLRGNPYVELVHWMHQVLQLQSSDLHCIVRALDLDAGRLAKDLTTTLDRLPRGATAISDLSPHLVAAVERAWIWATLKYNSRRIRTGHILLALLKTPVLRSVTIGISREFEKIKVDQLSDEFEQITEG